MHRRLIQIATLVAVLALSILGALQRPAAAPAQLAAAATSSPPAEEAAGDKEPAQMLYPVAKVVDGDTIDIAIGTSTTRLRLIGLDTPEIVDPRKPVQCFAREASAKAKELLTGREVHIEQDPSQGKYDKYGRLLAYVFLPDGTNFNERMIAEGYGHEYTYRLPYTYQEAFRAAEKTAREEKKGLWADDACAGDTKKPAS